MRTRPSRCPDARAHSTLASPPSHLEKNFKKPFTTSQLQQPPAGPPLTMESTRIFVSGLPPKFSNDQLKKHFSSRFQTTDAHVLPNRRIGFVGFKSREAAKEAVGYFNKSYVKMSKISVEIARPVCCCGSSVIVCAAVHADRLRWS